MSTNKPDIGSVVHEIAPVIFRKSQFYMVKLKPACEAINVLAEFCKQTCEYVVLSGVLSSILCS